MGKKVQNSIDILLEHACPSIQSRIRLEILAESLQSDDVLMLQSLILEDDLVKKVISQQQDDGWIGRDFHGFNSIEAGIRILTEKGIFPSNQVIERALDALSKGDNRLNLGIGKVGWILDDLGFGGTHRIKAAVFAYTGLKDESFIGDEIEKALMCFRFIRKVERVSDVYNKYRNKLVFKPGILWPDIYALRLLAFTNSWRSLENMAIISEAIHQLVLLSPIPQIYVRYKSQLIAPGSFGMNDFNPVLDQLDDAGWMMWFHRMEMLARLGIKKSIPHLQTQLGRVIGFIDQDSGLFNKQLNHYTFKKWGAYSGLMLERDWRSPKRREYDLTLRFLLILHYLNYM